MSFYETYRGKNTNRNRNRNRNKNGGGFGCGGCLFSGIARLILTILIIAALAAGVLYVLPVSMLNLAPEEKDLGLTKGLPSDVVNILLLGLDVEKDGQQRCDGIMVASIGMNSLKITSLQRDTEVEIPGYKGIHKLNSSYSYGGAELTMRVVNQTFGLNITDYIAVDFETMVNTVDAIGGIDLEIEEKELKWYNVYAYKTYRVLCRIDEAKYGHLLKPEDEVKQPGLVHMDGIHATGYCRIRYADSDYGRTYRQRKVIEAMLKKIKDRFYDPTLYVKVIKAVYGSLKTSLTLPELTSIGLKVLGAGMTSNIESYRAPQNAYIKDNGSTIEITNISKVREELYAFIYQKREKKDVSS